MVDGQYTQFPIDYRTYKLSGITDLQQDVEEITDRLDAVEEAIDSTIAFTVALPFSGWSENAQTVSNANFVASGFSYIVSASPDDLADYSESAIYADDVTTDGSMTFHCDSEPTTDITVNVTRLKVG